jgi:hypothetical protein
MVLPTAYTSSGTWLPSCCFINSSQATTTTILQAYPSKTSVSWWANKRMCNNSRESWTTPPKSLFFLEQQALEVKGGSEKCHVWATSQFPMDHIFSASYSENPGEWNYLMDSLHNPCIASSILSALAGLSSWCRSYSQIQIGIIIHDTILLDHVHKYSTRGWKIGDPLERCSVNFAPARSSPITVVAWLACYLDWLTASRKRCKERKEDRRELPKALSQKVIK